MSLRMGKITRTQVFNVGTGQGEMSLFSSEFLESSSKALKCIKALILRQWAALGLEGGVFLSLRDMIVPLSTGVSVHFC